MNLQDFMCWIDRDGDLIVSALMAVAFIVAALFGGEKVSKRTRFSMFLPLGIACIGGFLFCYSVNTDYQLMYTIGTWTLVAGFAIAMFYALVWFTKNTIKLFKTPKAV